MSSARDARDSGDPKRGFWNCLSGVFSKGGWIGKRVAKTVGKASPLRTSGGEVTTGKKKDCQRLSFWDYLEWIGRSYFYAPIVAVSVAWVGVMASLYPSQIRASLGNVALFSGDPLNKTATWFWFLTIVAGLLFWGRRAAEGRALKRENRERKRLIKSQEEAAEQLRLEVRTMPPDSFLSQFSTSFRSVERAFTKALEAFGDTESGYGAQRETLVLSIQSGLLSMIELARSFDENKSDRYAANVMLYIPSGALNDDAVQEVDDRLLHAADEVSSRNLRGVLDLRTDLTVVSESAEEDWSTDEDLQTVAFAIPQKHRSQETSYRDEQKWRTGPGAPKALLTGNADLFGDTREIREWLNNWSTLEEDAKFRILGYITSEGQPQIGSFFSSPLIPSSDDANIFLDGPEDETEENVDSQTNPLLDHALPYGVLNMHRSESGILKGRAESQEYFELVTLPIKDRLARLVGLLAHLEYDKHSTWQHL